MSPTMASMPTWSCRPRPQGLDWRPLVPKSDMANVPADARWIAFGAGERRVYLETPTWGDLTPRRPRRSR